MENNNKKDSIQKLSISEATNLNTVFEVLTSPKKVNLVQGLKGFELLKYIFEEIILLAQRIDFNLFIIEGEVTDIQKRLREILDANQPYTLIDNSKVKMSVDEKIVVVIEYLKLISEDNGLGFKFYSDKCFVYNGAFWVKYEKDHISEFLGDFSTKAGIPILQAKIPKIREKLVNQFCTTNSHFDIPNERKKINLLNGTYHFGKDGEQGLRPFSKIDYFTYQLSFNYDRNETAPMFEIFLNEVLPDRDCQKVLFEFLGYIFLDLKLERALMLLGSGANGKSVVFDIVTALLGSENISTYSLTELTESHYFRAELDTKLLNYSSELGRLKDFDTFKKLTSGEPITSRLPYEKPVQMTGYCKFMFNTNTLPTVEHTPAYFRRLLILPFNLTIPEEKRDVKLAEKIIKKELSGIFNLVLDGVERLIKQQAFTKAKVIDQLIRNYQKESNYVEMFLEEEGWIPSNKHKMLAKDFRSLYNEYCKENNVKALARRNFNSRLRSLGFEIVQENQNYFYVYCEKAPEKPSIMPDIQKSIDKLFFKPKDNE